MSTNKELKIKTLSLYMRRGVALMLVMIAILITGGMALAYFGSRDNSIAISSNVETSARARSVADSGLQLTIAILETNADWRTAHKDGILLGNYPIGDGIVSVLLIDSETNLPPTESTTNLEITVTSAVQGLKQLVRATATVISTGGVVDVDYSEFAVFARNKIYVSDQAEIKLWATSGASQSQGPIKIGTLATKPLSVKINSSQQSSKLNLYAVQKSSSMLTSGDLEKTVFSDVPPYPKPPKAPADASSFTLYPKVDSKKNKKKNKKKKGKHGDDNDSADAEPQTPLVLTAGAYKIKDFKLDGGLPVYIQGDVTIQVTNKFELNKTAIYLEEDATLTLFIEDSLTIDSSYIGAVDQEPGDWMDPSRVRIFGSGGNPWELKKDSVFKGELYAPKVKVKVVDTATIYGRISAKEVKLLDEARVLYDPVLDNGGFADFSSPIYKSDGSLYPEVKKLKSLDQVLLDVISQKYGSSVVAIGDWETDPAPRNNTVIYEVLTAGSDYTEWETIASTGKPPLTDITLATYTNITNLQTNTDAIKARESIVAEINQKQVELDLVIASGANSATIEQKQLELDAAKQKLKGDWIAIALAP